MEVWAKRSKQRNSLVVQWLGLRAFTSGAQAQPLVRELRSCKPHDAAKKEKRGKTNNNANRPANSLRISPLISQATDAILNRRIYGAHGIISVHKSRNKLATCQTCHVNKWQRCSKFFFFKNWGVVAAAAKSLQSCPTLCDPTDGNPPGSAVPGILQARTLEWVAISTSNAWKWKVKSEVAQSCPTLSNPMDCSLPGSSIHGIFSRQEYWSGVPLPSPEKQAIWIQILTQSPTSCVT